MARTLSIPDAAQPLPVKKKRRKQTHQLVRIYKVTRPVLTRRPVSIVRSVTQLDMLPKIIRARIAQVTAVQLNLIIRLGHQTLVLIHDAIVREKRRRHVYKVAPRCISSAMTGIHISEQTFSPQLHLRHSVADSSIGCPRHGCEQELELARGGVGIGRCDCRHIRCRRIHRQG